MARYFLFPLLILRRRKVLVAWLTLASLVHCHGYTLTDSAPTIKFIDNRLDGLNSSLVIVQHQIVSIQTEIKIWINNYYNDNTKLLAQIALLAEKIEKVEQLAEENELKITTLTATVTKLEEDLDSLEERVVQLEEINKLWKNNFLIVNRTFTILWNSGYLKA